MMAVMYTSQNDTYRGTSKDTQRILTHEGAHCEPKIECEHNSARVAHTWSAIEMRLACSCTVADVMEEKRFQTPHARLWQTQGAMHTSVCLT